MNNFDNVNALHALLSNTSTPVLKVKIQELLNCSLSDVERTVQDMRLYLDAPIKFNVESKSYYYDTAENENYELPGLWFNSSELYGLFASYQLLSEVGPGLLESHIDPIREKLESLMQSNAIEKGALENRVRILKMAARKPSAKHFSVVASALLMRKKLNIKYGGRDHTKPTERIISPQRLVHYRDNWYIDAWCHLREQLRTFSVDRIEYSRLVNEKSLEIENDKLKEHFATAFGIFSGKSNKEAVLQFNQSVAKWVAEEQWHPDQNGQFNLDGSYELTIPYRDARELIQDILKFGADVKVIKPDSLKNEVKTKIEQMNLLYKT